MSFYWVRRIHDEEKGYYADGEDAYDMRKYLKPRKEASANGTQGESKAKEADATDVAASLVKLSLADKEGGEAAENQASDS